MSKQTIPSVNKNQQNEDAFRKLKNGMSLLPERNFSKLVRTDKKFPERIALEADIEKLIYEAGREKSELELEPEPVKIQVQEIETKETPVAPQNSGSPFDSVKSCDQLIKDPHSNNKDFIKAVEGLINKIVDSKNVKLDSKYIERIAKNCRAFRKIMDGKSKLHPTQEAIIETLNRMRPRIIDIINSNSILTQAIADIIAEENKNLVAAQGFKLAHLKIEDLGQRVPSASPTSSSSSSEDNSEEELPKRPVSKSLSELKGEHDDARKKKMGENKKEVASFQSFNLNLDSVLSQLLASMPDQKNSPQLPPPPPSSSIAVQENSSSSMALPLSCNLNLEPVLNQLMSSLADQTNSPQLPQSPSSNGAGQENSSSSPSSMPRTQDNSNATPLVIRAQNPNSPD